MKKEYLFFYKTSGENYRTLHNDIFETVINTPSQETNNFELFKGYTPDDDGLVNFKADMIRWNDELMSNDILKINYLGYYNHMNATEMTFKRLCKGKYEHFDPIDATESKWIESTQNGGLIFCNAGIHQSTGYDFSSFYPFLMANYKFKMPYKKGIEKFITSIPSNPDVGFYRVKITSDHKHAPKVFAFSPSNTYTSISLIDAINLRDEYDFDFKIDLIIDDKPNAYIYDSFIRGHKVFENWLDILFNIKRAYPKNKLVKHLLSSLHGSLSRSNSIFKTSEAIDEENIDVSTGDDSDYKIIDYIRNETNEYYKLQSNKNPYRYNFRLKSFLSAFGRTKISEVALQHIDHVIRIQTDGIVFDSDVNLNFPLLIKEEKTTGMIEWKNCNSYLLL